MRGIVDQGKSAGLYEAVGFLRVNILSMFQQQDRLRLTVSSTAPGEGKSSITATLADAFATAGKRVLIIDGDLRRGTQQQVWEKYSASHDWKPLVGMGGSRNLQDALKNPDNVQVLRVEPNVDLLPAGPGLHESLVLLTQLDLGAILDRWSQAYDIVLIDSPPLLAIADGLVLARHTDGIVLVTEARTTSLQAIRAALRRVERSGLHVIGFVLNKVDVQKDTTYSYSYTPRTTQHSLD
nr:CpsD/CapB family tyrosine-protein kinase [Deinococcus budaensis]